MKPFSYSRWAARMVRLASKRSLRLPSCWRVEVVKGGEGVRVKGFSSAERILNSPDSSFAWSALASSAFRSSTSSRFSLPVSGSKSLPLAMRLPPSEVRRASKSLPSPSPLVAVKRAVRSQYSASTNRIRARSRSTMIFVATLWTRPAESRGLILRQRIGETSYP